jgi:tryptophan-rich sensory protein
MRWIELLFSFVLCFGVAGIGGAWTSGEIAGWYRTLRRPAIAPPDWVFGPVWALLYALMAIALWRTWLAAASPLRFWAIAAFFVQLALNLSWSWIFFRRHAIGSALTEVVALWIAIALTAVLFTRVAPVAAWLMAPYLAWVTFATALNFAFWRLN